MEDSAARAGDFLTTIIEMGSEFGPGMFILTISIVLFFAFMCLGLWLLSRKNTKQDNVNDKLIEFLGVNVSENQLLRETILDLKQGMTKLVVAQANIAKVVARFDDPERRKKAHAYQNCVSDLCNYTHKNDPDGWPYPNMKTYSESNPVKLSND